MKTRWCELTSPFIMKVTKWNDIIPRWPHIELVRYLTRNTLFHWWKDHSGFNVWGSGELWRWRSSCWWVRNDWSHFAGLCEDKGTGFTHQRILVHTPCHIEWKDRRIPQAIEVLDTRNRTLVSWLAVALCYPASLTLEYFPYLVVLPAFKMQRQGPRRLAESRHDQLRA